MSKRLDKILAAGVAALTVTCSAAVLASCQDDSVEGYTVTFVTDGGTSYGKIETQAPGQAIVLSVPEKYGSVFKGWYETSTFEGEAIVGEYVPTGDATLYAKWEAVEYTVTFETDGGTQYLPVVSQGRAIALPLPKKADYKFLGWYDNAQGEGEKLGDSYLPQGNVVLYAKWEKQYREISFRTDGGTTHTPLKDFGEGVELPTPQKYGYEFLGWYENESLTGDPVSQTYAATENITLWAKWKKVTYVYLYYGTLTEHVRLSYDAGTAIDVGELAPPEELVIDGISCPFVKWVYDGESAQDVPDSITLGEDHIYLVAVYDFSALPPKENVAENADGSWTSTGKSIKILVDEGENEGAYTMDATFRKGKSGSVNLALRMIHSGADYAYEDLGTEYIALGLIPSSGGLQISKVIDGKWSTIRGNMALEDLPKSWQDRFNAASASDRITVNMRVYDYGDRFEFYIDGELAYTCSDRALLQSFEGTGFGMRSSTADAVFSDFEYRAFKTVRFEANGGTECKAVLYAMGKLNAPVPTKEEYVFTGWYYDQACTKAVDLDRPEIDGDEATLYAGWREARYRVTLFKDGETYRSIGYESGAIALPDLSNERNKIFTGWYYDEACTRKVDSEAPEIAGNVTLYAGWRYPTHKNFIDNGDGTYGVGNGSAAAVIGEAKFEYYQFSMNYVFAKGSGGAGGIAFRMAIYADDSYEKHELGCQYISAGIDPNAGLLQVGRIDNGFAQMKGSKVTLEKLPAAWQQKFNAAASGEQIAVTISVRDYGEYFEIYLDGRLSFTSNEDIGGFQGRGYGVRSSTKNVSFTVSVEEIPSYRVSFDEKGGESVDDLIYIEGVSVALPKVEKASYIFLGWYYDDACTQAVDETLFAPTQDITLYAGWKAAAYTISLESNCENALDDVYYESGAIELPTPATKLANKIFNGWYYDEACTRKVDADAPEIAQDMTLYAGWRYPTHSNFTDNKDGTYSVGASGKLAVVIGETTFGHTEYSMNYTFKKGAGGAGGLAFRMQLYADNSFETKGSGTNYIAVGVTGAGVLAVSKVEDGAWARICGDIALAKLPQGWQDKMNAAQTDAEVTVNITVRDYGSYFEIYLDGSLAYTCEDTELLSRFTGTGYGSRSTTMNVTFDCTVKEINVEENVG